MTSLNTLSNWDNTSFELISLLTLTSKSQTHNSKSSYPHPCPSPGTPSPKTMLDKGLISLRQIPRNLWLLKSSSALYVRNTTGGQDEQRMSQPILWFRNPVLNLLNPTSPSASAKTPKTIIKNGAHTASTITTMMLIVTSSTTPRHAPFADWRVILTSSVERRGWMRRMRMGRKGSQKEIGEEMQRSRRKMLRML